MLKAKGQLWNILDGKFGNEETKGIGLMNYYVIIVFNIHQ